jgi:LacI family transcriptional regulator
MANSMKRASTLHDVAALVGVSPRTVSRVVNDQGGFSEATRQRVMDAVTQLRYRPNVMARGLITRRSNTVAFVVPALNDPFFPDIAHGVQSAAADANLTMLFAMSNGDIGAENNVLTRLDAHAPDGVIIFPARGTDHLLAHLDRGMRMVVIDSEVTHPNATSVMSDLRSGAHLAVERLVQRGCRQLAMISSSTSNAQLQRRQTGFLESLPEGMAPIVYVVDPTIDGGRSAAAALVEEHPDVDGIFADNDVVAIGAIQALQAAGLSVPDDVAVVGCDDIEMGSVITPALTTVRSGRERLGNEAVRALVALVQDEPIESPSVLPVELVERASG